jgi:hypothetical protein
MTHSFFCLLFDLIVTSHQMHRRSAICFLVSVRSAVLGPWPRLEIRSQFGKGVLNVNVAGRICELQTFFGLLQIFLRRQHDGTKRS